MSLALLALAVPTAAAAQVVPPGNSGVDQYKESVPSVGGNQPSGPGGPSGSKSGSGSGAGGVSSSSRISPATARSLEKLGPDGKATAGLAAETAPAPSHNSGSGSSDPGPSMGWALPVILALALAAAVSIAVLRRRRGTPPPGAA